LTVGEVAADPVGPAQRQGRLADSGRARQYGDCTLARPQQPVQLPQLRLASDEAGGVHWKVLGYRRHRQVYGGRNLRVARLSAKDLGWAAGHVTRTRKIQSRVVPEYRRMQFLQIPAGVHA
jgi:hypothetical protein